MTSQTNPEEALMANIVTPQHLEQGALWTFVHRGGETVEYVFDRMLLPATPSGDPKVPGLCAMFALTNPVTGKDAMVSEKWLREGEVTGGPHWLPKAPAQELADAA